MKTFRPYLSWIPFTFLLLLAQLTSARDNRCFLIGGGSAETFFVSENATVGSVIGVLRIAGDPSADGDITLRLEANETVVSIDTHTKNLTLIKALDKEGLTGPAQVMTRITCERRGPNTEPSLTVPVNIRVTDANDNSPIFRNATYSVNISESTMVGSVVLQGIEALDADQPGPYSTVQYSILPGPYSDVLGFASSLEGTLVLKKAVDYETLKHFKIAIRAQDQGQPPLYTDAIVSIDINDADDQNPLFGQSRYWAHLPQPAQKGTGLEIRPEPMRAVDQDAGINASIRYAWNAGGVEYQDFVLDPLNGSVFLNRSLEDNELVQPVILVVKAHQVDNLDRYALTTLTVSRSWSFSPQLQYLQRRYSVQVLENVPVDTIILAMAINKPIDQTIRFVIESHNGTDQAFSVDKMGEIKLERALDYETQMTHHFVVWVTDGLTNDTATVEVTVLDVNDWDPRFDLAEYEFIVKESALPVGSVIGHIHADDGDAADRVTIQLKGPESRAFNVHENGDVIFSDPSALNSTVIHLMAVARDSGNPPRQTSVPVKINLPVDFLMMNGSGITLSSADGSGLLLIILGILLGVLSLIISGLAVYLCQYKRKKTQPSPLTVVQPQPKVSVSGLYSGDSSTPITATLRRMPINPLARPSCRRVVPIQSPTLSTVQNSPPPPPMPPPTPPPRQQQQQQAAGNHHKISSGGSNNNEQSPPPVACPHHPRTFLSSSQAGAWPTDASLPRRVKKLSWEDEFNVFF
ncbi:cadherin EGF LAG seven-pass G-type receptor 1-like [Daphnia carinata]|uniref:cadherin EGF LAG seven-pass G-type receptor 1-like n=1 Tax=Daphnia carinata TaxID=120202 RepID=UPI00257C5049|nr:cadherin EGF LAG seven-pass G-type receptor 1-like [Daphnia carinata]